MQTQFSSTNVAAARSVAAGLRVTTVRCSVTAGALSLAAALLVGVNAAPVHAADNQPVPALTVTTAAPVRAQWPDSLNASGAIGSWQDAVVGTQVGGLRIVEILAEVGDAVTRGQVLVRFDADMLRADEAELQADVAQMQAALIQAQANRQRAENLQGRGALSDQDILQLLTQADIVQAQVAAARARLASKRLQLQYAQVVAPDDGVISERSATLGAVAQAGQELFRMIRQGRLEWRGELTAQQIAQIAIGQQITLTLPDGSPATARVRQTAPAMDADSRLAIVYADIEPGSSARAGMYANGSIVIQHSEALVIPAVSVVIRDGRSLVLKVDGNGNTPRVVSQPVSVGRRVAGQVEILQGLTANDRVVEKGAGFLNDGDVVRVVPDAALSVVE